MSQLELKLGVVEEDFLWEVTVPLHRVKAGCFAHHSGTFSPPLILYNEKSALRKLSIFEKPPFAWLIP